jgi:predicted dehydrogenase
VNVHSHLRGAIIGFGSMGRRHAENLAKLGVTDLTIVRRPDRQNPAFPPPPTARIATSDAQAVAGGLDFALICNPTRFHVDTASYYLKAGVSVLVEKPISDSVDDAQQLADEARRCGVLACTAYCTRYHPAYAAARQAIVSGKIGRVLYAKACFEGYLPAWHPWEDYRQSYAAKKDLGGGALRTLDHDVDFLNWCLGTPAGVVGYSSRSGAIETDADDHAAMLIRYREGPVAGVWLALCRQDRARRFEFVGDQGALTFDWDDPQLRLMPGNRDTASVLLDYRGRDFAEMYVDMLKDYLDAVAKKGGSDALADLDCGLRAIRACCGAESHTFSEDLR